MFLLGFFWIGHLLSFSSLTDIVYPLPYWNGFTMGVGRCHSTSMEVLSGDNLQKSIPSTVQHSELSSAC